MKSGSFNSSHTCEDTKHLVLYKTIFEHMTNEVHIWELVRNEKGKILTWKLKDANPAALKSWGKKREEVIGKVTNDIFDDENATQTFMPIVEKIFSNMQPYYWQTYFAGTNQILDMISIPIGEYFISTGVDVTSQKQTDNFIQQAHRMDSLGVIAGGVAHDMNNLLGIILGNALLLQKCEPQDNLQENIQSIIAASKKGKELTNLILGYAKNDKNEKEVVDLKSVVSEIVSLLKTSLSRNISLHFEPSSSKFLIKANRVHLNQIILNIANNAIKAMSKNGGDLSFHLEKREIISSQIPEGAVSAKPGKYIKLTISDTGEGIKEDIIKNIFDPFFTTKGESKGKGLGLSIVKTLVSDHNGFITINSLPGKGSQFFLHFPLVERVD